MSNGPKCPVCTDQMQTRASHPRPVDRIWIALGWYPWRCRNCHHRFHSRYKPDAGRPDAEHTLRMKKSA